MFFLFDETRIRVFCKHFFIALLNTSEGSAGRKTLDFHRPNEKWILLKYDE